MNTTTKPSPHPYYHVIIAKNQESVILCILNGDGKGGYDHWNVDEKGHKRVEGISGSHFFQDYWQDYLSSEVIINIYKVLDFYANVCDNIEEGVLKEPETCGTLVDFTADDIPF